MKQTANNATAPAQLHPIVIEMWRRLAAWADAQERARIASAKSGK